MKNDRLIKLLDELRSHLDMSQGMDLKSMLDQSKMGESQVGVENPDEEALETDENEPKGVSMEKVSLMGKPAIPGEKESAMEEDGMDKLPGEEEMSEDELEELLKKLT